MKNLSLLLFLSFFTQTISAQSFAKSFPESYNSNVEHAITLNDGTVILSIRNSGQDTNYRDINSFKALDSTGTVIWEANLSEEGDYAGSFYHIMDMKASPDGGWLVSGGMFDCDYYSFGFVVKFSADFEEEWIVKSHELLPNGYIGEFYRLQIGAEKIHFYSFSDIVTLDYSGNLLVHIDLSNSYFSFAVANETQIYAHTSDLGWHILSYPEGNMTNEDLPFPDELSRIEILNEEENICAISAYQDDVKIFLDLNEVLEVPASSDLERIMIFENENQDFGVAEMYEENIVVSLYDGENLSELTNGEFNFPTDVELSTVTAVGNQIIAGGKERYVPISYYEKKNVAVAFSQVLVMDIDLPQPTLDLAITNLSVTNPVITSVFDVYPDGEGQRYNFTDIEITVTNNSSELVNSYAINTSFEPSTYTFFCDPYLDYSQQVENTSLAPEESQTIYIDALTTHAVNDTTGYQLCFWVAHPNNEPDLIGTNDIFCTDFVKDLISSTDNTLAQSPLNIYPNPVTNYLYFEENSQFEEFVIFSLEGKKMGAGNLNEGQRIDVKHLAKGIYLLQASSEAGRANLKFVKQ